MMAEGDFIATKFLCFIIKMTSSHSCAEIAGGFFNVEYGFKNI